MNINCNKCHARYLMESALFKGAKWVRVRYRRCGNALYVLNSVEMRRIGAVKIFVTMFILVLSMAVPASGGFLQDGSGLVSMEAEHYEANIPQGGYSWDPVANAGYSGSGALRAMPFLGLPPLSAGAGPRMDYQVQFTTTGTHYVWIRGLRFSGSSDSLYVTLDGGTVAAPAVTGLNLDGTTWKWSKGTQSGGIATINVTSTGWHTINVWMRE